MKHSHFEGKSVVEHLRAARTRGALASAEIHGTEMPGHLSAAADSAKETTILLLLLWALFPVDIRLFLLFATGVLIWKTARSALLGWSRLSRLHRLIEEERWEIEHHRQQEREELTELYKAKGLSGKLLDETVTVLMADDNRLLRLMLEEEMGLTLEVYEHPLKQSAGAALGVIGAVALFLLGYFFAPWGPIVTAPLAIGLAVYLATSSEKNRLLESTVWTVSAAAFAVGTVYLLNQL